MVETADVVVIGGGCMGTSIAMHLAGKGVGSVTLLERNGLASGPTGRSSAVLRQHYPVPELAVTAQRSLEVYANFGEVVGGEAGFVRTGFLMGVGEQDTTALLANVSMLVELGIRIEVLTPSALRELVPQLYVEDVGLAAYHPDVGYADPWGVTAGFAAAARRKGVRIDEQTRVTGIKLKGDRVAGVVAGDREIATPVVVNAAGPWSPEIGCMVGVELPVRPVRHELAIFQRPADFGPAHPIYGDTLTDAYFKPEGKDLTLCGTISHPYLDVPLDLDGPDVKPGAEAQARFADAVVHRMPAMASSVSRGGFTGIYDVTPDGQPILGPLPNPRGFYCCLGWSGHGFKHAPEMGKLLAEWIVDGAPSLDLSAYQWGRFQRGELIRPRHQYSARGTGF